jgi:hypothetical protein
VQWLLLERYHAVASAKRADEPEGQR